MYVWMYCSLLSGRLEHIREVVGYFHSHLQSPFCSQECRSQPIIYSIFNSMPDPISRRLDRRRGCRPARNRTTVDGYTKRAAASNVQPLALNSRYLLAHLASSTFYRYLRSWIIGIQLLRVCLKTPGPEDAGATTPPLGLVQLLNNCPTGMCTGTVIRELQLTRWPWRELARPFRAPIPHWPIRRHERRPSAGASEGGGA
ncbi:hypothetical protein B0T13DRAFT_29444 [Neurospora crassa]|nr:hypothetical protein B0T13DRAFT_29444 [Neurospora crassa]